MERSDDASAAADGRQLGGAMYVYNSVALGTMERHKLPENPSEPDIVYRHIQELRLFDSNPRLNLASYVTTWMEDPARQLIMDSLAVNHVDGAIYASSNDIEARCISIMAALWHAPNPQNVMGCATVGSTEACLLGGLNMKKWWAQRRKEKGLATDKPNLIVCSCFQVCWEKFAKYWDVELRLGKLKEGSYTLTPEAVEELADENTIGVAAILGSTYTGDLDDVQALSAMSDKLREEKGLELPIHVDAASGGFVAPFLFPDLVWDFQLKVGGGSNSPTVQ
ncbi:hypothetical protein QJQ45_001216 [Haematococcus lacustris]|nr:hypothetical protein QJQ45_001216 [Haematococcus lacustris]